MGLEGLKLRKPIKKLVEEPKKKKFNFGTMTRAEGSVKDIAWLEDVSKAQLVYWWKIAQTRKQLTKEEIAKMKDVKYYLKNKFNVEVPKK